MGSDSRLQTAHHGSRPRMATALHCRNRAPAQTVEPFLRQALPPVTEVHPLFWRLLPMVGDNLPPRALHNNGVADFVVNLEFLIAASLPMLTIK